jgi:5-methylcytosine-specific restriction enzyme subunit McrC
MTAIPIRNIYYLLSYAWNLLAEAEVLAVQTEDLPNVLNLLTRLLTHGTQRLLKRGMDRGYLPQTDVLTTLRGKVAFAASSRRMLLEQAKAQCDFEEFLPDLLHNRILKATLQMLVLSPDIAARQRAEVQAVLRRMADISPLQIRKAHFNQIRLHRNNAHYRLLMHICELVHANLLVNEQTGQMTFRDLLRDERQMAQLFEAFVANFYREETDWQVTTQERIPWNCPNPSSLLPEMHADAVLRGPGRVVVVECKFYRETLQVGPWSDRAKLHSPHLYQLTSYLENLQVSCRHQPVEGLLVYPVVGLHVHEDLLLSGKLIRARTLDLSCSWEAIAAQMKGFLARHEVARTL